MDINEKIGEISGMISGMQASISAQLISIEKIFNEKFSTVHHSLGDYKDTTKKNEKRIAALELIISNWTSSWKVVSGAVVGLGAVIAFIVTTVMYWLKG